MSPTLDALRRDRNLAEVVRVLRGEGWADWQILLAEHNLAKSSRLTVTAPTTRAEALQLLAGVQSQL